MDIKKLSKSRILMIIIIIIVGIILISSVIGYIFYKKKVKSDTLEDEELNQKDKDKDKNNSKKVTFNEKVEYDESNKIQESLDNALKPDKNTDALDKLNEI